MSRVFVLSISFAHVSLGSYLRHSMVEITELKTDRGVPWLMESSLAGGAPSQCDSLTPDKLPDCTDDRFQQFVNLSTVLKENPAGIIDEAGTTMLVGTDGPLALYPCRKNAGGKGLHLIVDSQFANTPRCCSAMDLKEEWLVTHDDKPMKKAIDVGKTFERHSLNGVDYVQVSPPTPCASESKCPLVIFLAGDGEIVPGIGDPWLLLQAGCDACRSELGSTIVSPKLTMDIIGPDGRTDGSSDAMIDKELVPFVKGLLEQNSGLDPERVILVGSSLGVDTMLRAAVRNPDLSSLLVLSGMFRMTPETVKLLKDGPATASAKYGRLRSIQFHVGDLDRAFEPQDYYQQLELITSYFDTETPSLDLRVYPEGHHNVWFAAWNALHDTIWTAHHTPEDGIGNVRLTCSGQAQSL